jgi:hypothetical protein
MTISDEHWPAMPSEPRHLYGAIVAVFDDLGFYQLGNEPHRHGVERAAASLAIIAGAVEKSLPPEVTKRRLRSYTDCSKQTVLAELEKIVSALEKAHAAIAGAHGPTIIALAEAGLGASDYRSDQWFKRLLLIKQAAERAIGVVREKPEWTPGPPTRSTLPRLVAAVVMGAFEELSGGNADLPAERGGCPGLEGCVRRIFEIMKIDADPKASLRAALTERAKQRQTAEDRRAS